MSLAALGKVLAALAAQSSQLPQQNGFGNGSSPTRAYVPFRDSKLTLVLKDSLQVQPSVWGVGAPVYGVKLA